jgi:hypothetical protein
MPALSIQPPFPIFTDTDGQPLENGYIWIGTANQNPITNPITAYWDAALTVPAAQPVRTLNGYPSNAGTPARLYVNSDYSIQVQNKIGSVVYSAPAAGERFSGVVVNVDASEVSYSPTGTGSIARTVQAKLRETVSILDFAGVDPTGVTGSSVGIQAAIDSGANTVHVPEGTYLIDATIIIPDEMHLMCDSGSVFKPSANNLVMFTTKDYSGTKHAYFSQIWNAQLDANGKTGVVGFDMYGLRHAAGIFFPKFLGAFNHCIKLSELCWDCIIEEPFAQGCVNGILIAHGSNAVQVRKPGFDGLGSAGYGIKIMGGPTYPTTSVSVIGGYIQGFSGAGGVGIWDAGSGTTLGTYGTCIRDVYFELIDFADIYWDESLYASSIGCQHYVSSGQNANYGRNCEGVRIYSPLMTSGSRSVGLYNFDTSNTGCFGDRAISSVTGINLPVGTVSGIGSLPSEEWGTFTVTVLSSGGANTGITYGTQLAKWHRIGQRVNINVQVSWSGWTGPAGSVIVRGTPAFLVPASYTPTGIGVVIGLMTWAGDNLYCYLSGTAQDITIVQNTTAGAITALPMAALGSLALDLTYSI